MTKVGRRDRETAQKQGVLESRARSIKNLLSEARNDVEEKITGKNPNTNTSAEEQLEQLQKYLFGTKESFPYTSTVTELRELKLWIERMAEKYFLVGAISLFEACYLAEFNHTNRVGIIKELNAKRKRFEVVLRVINECVMMRTSLRRFTKDEQNAFLYGE